jgi:hypothetical protein
MEAILAVFPSLNQVSLIRRKLHHDGVYVEMTRAPQCLAATGCSFALRCTFAELDLVLRAGREAGIVPGGLFRESVQDAERVYVPFDVDVDQARRT